MEGPLPVVMECYEDVFEEIANKFYASDPLPKSHYGNPADVARLNSRLWPNGPSLAQSMIGMPLYPGTAASSAPLLAANRAMSIATGGGNVNNVGGVSSSGGPGGGPSNNLDNGGGHNNNNNNNNNNNEGGGGGGGGGGRNNNQGGGGGPSRSHKKKGGGGGRGGGNNPGKDMWIENKESLSWANSKVASYNPNTKMFKCTDCDTVGFLSRIAEHWLGSHANIKVFQCPRCPYSSAWARCVRMHMTRHHNEQHTDLTLWKDNPMLDEVAKLLQNLKNKVENKEPGDMDKKYACPHCPYATDRKDLFTRHENIHRDDKPFHCYVCYKMFNRADHVKKHFFRIHKDHVYDINLIRRHPPKSPYTSSSSGGGGASGGAYSKAQHNNSHHHHGGGNHHLQHHQQGHHGGEGGPTAPPPQPPPPPSQQQQQQQPPSAAAAAAAAVAAAAAAHLDNGLDGGGPGGAGGGSGKSKSKKKLPRMFVCTYCSWRGVDNWCLKRHLNTHIKPFLCVLCDYKAARAERLTTHVFKVHNKRICSKCGFLTEELSSLTAHMQQSHGRSHDGSSSSGAHQQQHHHSSSPAAQYHHHHQQPLVHKCDRCGEGFDVRCELEAHCILTHHADLMDCDRCDFRTANLSSLQHHRLERHAHEGPIAPYVPIISKHHQMGGGPHQAPSSSSAALREVRCRECGCEFADHSSLQTHFLLLHKSERVKRGPKLTSSSSSPTAPAHYSCSVCHSGAPTQSRMMEHMRSHTGQTLSCAADECAFATPFDSVLREHVRAAHAPNDDFVLRCPHCGRAFAGRHALARHLLAHHQLPCALCRRLLRTNAALHVRRRLGPKINATTRKGRPTPLLMRSKRRNAFLSHRKSAVTTTVMKRNRKCCRMCEPPKRFVTNSTYNTHVLWRHRGGPGGPGGRGRFSCGACASRFLHKHQLTLHRKRCSHATQRNGT